MWFECQHKLLLYIPTMVQTSSNDNIWAACIYDPDDDCKYKCLTWKMKLWKNTLFLNFWYTCI